MATIAFGQSGTPEVPKIEIESILSDGSYILVISGKRHRAFNEGQWKSINETYKERNIYREEFFQCRSHLLEKNIAE